MRFIVVFALVLLAACSEEVLLPVHKLSSSSLFFDLEHPSTTLYLRNTGQSALPWKIQVEATLGAVVADPVEGSVAPGDSVGIVLTADFKKVPSQDLMRTVIQLTMPATFNEQIPVDILNFKEERMPLNGIVIDAEYNRTRDIMVIVTASNKLIILNPETSQVTTIGLEFKPTCVSISPDGKYAVVGHRGVVTYVNLESQTIERTVGLTFSVSDIVLTNSAWCYLMPAELQWTNIYSINFKSQVEKTSWNSIYSDCITRLHPNGAHIYAATTQLSPSDFMNMDINDGVVSYPRDSPYHGDYDFGGDLWFADDGTKVFAKSGNVFSTSDDPTKDLRFIGKIPFDSNDLRFHTLDHSSVANRVYAVIGSRNDPYYQSNQPMQSNQVTKYDLSYNVVGVVPLGYFRTKDNFNKDVLVKSEGRFGFFNSMGTKFYVVVKTGVQADTPSYYTEVDQKWAVVSIDVE